MPYHNRRWDVEDVSLEELADCIAYSTFVLCHGFRCDGILWLHDSATEGSVQEWALVRERDGKQCESITTGWLDAEETKALIYAEQRRYAEGGKPMFGEGQQLQPGALDHGKVCDLCGQRRHTGYLKKTHSP